MSSVVNLSISQAGMAFDSSTGESYQLNEAASLILGCVQQGKSTEEIAQLLAQKYQIAYERALTDVLEFQVQIQLLGIIF